MWNQFLTLFSARKLLLLRGSILLFAVVSSLVMGRHFFQQGLTNLYGDGVAHLNIARRVIDLASDSWWAHYAQLGSPWLPWPHILALPLVWNDKLWRSGLAGSIVSMVSYVVAVGSSFEIGWRFYYWQQNGLWGLNSTTPMSTTIRECNSDPMRNQPVTLANVQGREPGMLAGVWAAIVMATNPSLLYLQTTPMTEVVFLACYLTAIWALLVWAQHFTTRALILAGIGLTLAALTRYEAWPVLGLSWLWVCLVARKSRWQIGLWWGLLLAVGPLYWLWHNWATYGNVWEFYHGFYSAKGIYGRLQARLGWADFVRGNWLWAVLVASTAAVACSGLGAYLITLAAAVKSLVNVGRATCSRPQQLAHLLLLIIIGFPFLFIIYSLYSGNIQIYPWSALSLLNVRYGITLLLPLAFWPISWFVSSNNVSNMNNVNNSNNLLVVDLEAKFESTLESTLVDGLLDQEAFFERSGYKALEHKNCEVRINRDARRWFIGLLVVISVQYGLIFAEGSKQLAVVQEPYRNNYNLPTAEARRRLAAHLRQQAVVGKVLLAHGELLPVVSESNLRFCDVILTTGQPATTIAALALAHRVIVREDEPLWQTLQQQPEFWQQFQLVYYVQPAPRLMLWQRRPIKAPR